MNYELTINIESTVDLKLGYFLQTAKDLDQNLQELGANQFFPIGLGNENIAESSTGGSYADFDEWKNHLIHYIVSGKVMKTFEQKTSKRDLDEGTSELVESSSEDEDNSTEVNGTTGTKNTKAQSESVNNKSGLVDLEDLGTVVSKARLKIQEEKRAKSNGVLKEMVTPELRKALTKQGYKLVGSHSGVKLCRWTKVRTQEQSTLI